ncbi:hypothetical protein V6N11_014410 [Hibiscus sabdariffa]|uniref:Uncharacterized protein n=1 Tax=Hibiscus sabdariffa TaxID=183260 RepID=A0ABR2NFM1_9ROSI
MLLSSHQVTRRQAIAPPPEEKETPETRGGRKPTPSPLPSTTERESKEHLNSDKQPKGEGLEEAARKEERKRQEGKGEKIERKVERIFCRCRWNF